MKIGLDFDHVLFDTDRLKRRLIDHFDAFNDTYDDAKDRQGSYRPGRHAELMEVTRDDFDRVVHDHAAACLYDDVGQLRELDGHDRVIVTRGDPDFQSLKIRASGIEELVENTVVVETKSKDRAGIDFLVDDTAQEHERTSIPGMHFDRSMHRIEDLVARVKEHTG